MDVGVRELRQNRSVYLDRIKLGETLRVTERGKPVALLTPLTGPTSRLDALIAAGLARPGRGRLHEIEPIELTIPPGGSQTPISDALQELRGERLD
jgi:antitoxin (DNA-binding transcriptional repressor) of toxin-antitoxin stability system